MNETTQFQRFVDELADKEHDAAVMHLALQLINVLPCLDDDLIDYLAVEVSREQVSRAASDG